MVRTLRLEDYESYSALRSLGLITEPTSFWASESEELLTRALRYQETIKHADNFMIGYFHKEVLVSIGGFVRENRLKLKHKGFIWGVFTHPDHRGQGFGKKLMSGLIDQALMLSGLVQINLSTRTNNHSAISLYEKLGFEKYGTEKNAALVDDLFYDEVYMVKHSPY